MLHKGDEITSVKELKRPFEQNLYIGNEETDFLS